MRVLVLDIGGTAIKHGICKNAILTDVKETPTNAGLGGRHVMDTVLSIIRSEPGSFDAIGVSTAGQVNSETGSIIYANQNIPGYTGTEIRRELEEAFKVPVYVENDVNCAAVGEAFFGAGRDYESFLMLTYGTGIGGASVTNRTIFHGSSFSASEFGAIITHSDARLAGTDYFDGCYERYASTTGLVRMAMECDPLLDTGRKVFEALDRPPILAVLDSWVDEIMLGIATLTHIYNPSCIILGGGVMEQPLVQEKINARKDFFIMPSFSHVKLIPAALGNTAGLMGAYYLSSTYAKSLNAS